MTHVKDSTAEQASADSVKISAIVEAFVTPERLDSLFSPSAFPIQSIVPRDRYGLSREFSLKLTELTRLLAIELRDAGLCSPCPNSDHHGIEGMNAWNALLEGKWDQPIEEKNFDRFALARAPLFAAMESAIAAGATKYHRSLWESANPGQKGDYLDSSPVTTPEEYQSCLASISSYIQSELAKNDGLNIHSNERSHLIKETILNWGPMTLLRPVLSIMDKITGKTSPLPVTEESKSVRHLRLSMPSGRLIMADWFRIEGFQEGITALLPDDERFEINYAHGLDERAKAYFETLGLVIVQVGNTSPQAYEDVKGIWRLGFVDEDHDAFWAEDGQATGLEMPTSVWGTSTNLWANTFADVQVIADILMASGSYHSREDAVATVEAYASEYGVHITNVGADHLHLYLPTGLGIGKENFRDVFRANELAYPEWREDAYVLSRTPLTVDPRIVETCSWVEGRITPDISHPEESARLAVSRPRAG